MAKRITELTSATVLAETDLLPVVDVSDTTQATSGTHYVIMIGGSTGADINNCVKVGYDNSSLTHAGNLITKDIYGWAVSDLYDTCFYVYAEPTTPIVGDTYPLPAFKQA